MKLEYKWIVLINTTIGMLMAAINQTIVLISLPAIFSGLHVDPTEQRTNREDDEAQVVDPHAAEHVCISRQASRTSCYGC